MKKLTIKTDRLIITTFDINMANSVHLNSLDDDNRLFVPDEVFETEQEAKKVIKTLMDCYNNVNGPFVYPILLKTGENIGYLQAVPIEDEWEVGYHIGKKYTNNGYASEALKHFLPYIIDKLEINQIWGICRSDNIASIKVLEKCNFKLEYCGLGNYRGQVHQICNYLYKV
ncbi:MAG: GNAT family N-acetyltransferase [Acholeplasmataceae bacterium]|nr:GNAT family N-acetyltransferase [Acholeplasmataceae bacterium]